VLGPSKLAPSSDFNDLWNLGLGGGSSSNGISAIAAPAGGKSIKDLQREKMEAGMWGNVATPTNTALRATDPGVQGKLVGPNDDDLLL